jgi:hypothetical protein
MRQILQFLRLLQEEKIPFVAVGMSAARLHGAPVVTEDFDLWVPSIDSETLERLAAKVDAVLSGGREPPCALNFSDGLPVDLVRRLSSRLAMERALRISKKVRIQGIAFPVLPLEEIIRSKKAAGRPKDLAALPMLINFQRAKKTIRDRSKKKA